MRSSPPSSDAYEKAQQISVRISSASFSISTFVNEGMQRFKYLKEAIGLPLQKFARAQLAFRVKELPAGA